MKHHLAEDETPSLSFAAWCGRQAMRDDKVGAFCRWYVDGAVGQPRWGSDEAHAEFDAYWARAVRTPAVRKATDALAAEALRRRHERPVEPAIEPDEAWDAMLAVLALSTELVGELIDYVVVAEGRPRFTRRLDKAQRLVDRLREVPHPSHSSFTTNNPLTREAS